MKIRSLSFKLALLVGTLGLLQAIAVLIFSYSTMSSSLDEQRRRILLHKMEEVRDMLDTVPNAAALSETAYRVADLLAGNEDLHVAVASSAQGPQLIGFSFIAAESLNRLRNDVWAKDGFLEWRSAQSDSEVLSVASASQAKNKEEYVIVLTSDRSSDRALLSEFLFTALTAAPFGLVLVSVGALVIVNIGLKPLNRFRRTAISISTKSISERIDPSTLPTELIPLCHAFNGMLERLEEGIRRLSQFSADLAHEMRTPIANLLGRTQVALSQPRSHEQLMTLIEGNVEELDRLSRLVTDMLFLAHADSTEALVKSTAVDLVAETRKVTEYLDFIAQERGVGFHVVGEGAVWADQGLVRRAIMNLLSNAVRYGAANSEVVIRIAADAEEARLDVMNYGLPIPAEHQVKLFDRFYRADASRAREVGGTGLGLAIVKAIMKLHDGDVNVSSDSSGQTHFVLRFPAKAVYPSQLSATAAA